MTDRGLKHLAKIRFDVEQLTVHAETEQEKDLTGKLDRAVKQLCADLNYRYNRRKEEIVER